MSSEHSSNSNQPEGQPSPFGGKAGEAVPEVDADDVKAVWRQYRELQDRHPGQHVAIGLEVLKSVCKDGANVEAVCYRQVQLDIVKILAEQNAIPQASMDLLTEGGEFKDSAFEAIAKIPMKWIGSGQRQGFPFDMAQFIKLGST